MLEARLAEKGGGSFVGPSARRVMLGDLEPLLEGSYNDRKNRSWGRVQTALKHLRPFFRGWRAVNITPVALDRYVSHRRREGAGDATIKYELAVLRRAFRVAVKKKVLVSQPAFPELSVDNTRERFIDDELGGSLDRLLAELPEPLRPVVRFAYLTAWRKGEILGLEWWQVDLRERVITLPRRKSKNKQVREVSFASYPQLGELLDEQRRIADEVERRTGQVVRSVFHRDGKRIKSMRGAWKGACKRAGIPDAWFHDLRRSAVRAMELAGVPRKVAMSFSGHETESVYARYHIVDRKAQDEGAARLAAYHAGRKTEPPSTVLFRKAVEK